MMHFFCSFHKQGHFIWPDGAEYTGDFRNGQREGHGGESCNDAFTSN